MHLLLGLDQGSTKTHAVITELTGRVLGVGAAPGSLHTTRGMEDALLRIGQACDQAISQAGYTRADIAYISGGIAGIDYPYEVDLLSEALGNYFCIPKDNIFVNNDCVGALWGGSFEIPSVVCCVGTGLAVGGTDEHGQVHVFGNYCNGPFQGGSSIGQAGLQAVFDAHIGKEPQTSLTDKMLRFTGARDIDELLLLRYRKKTVSPSPLCPLVFEAAAEGDAVSISILTEFARHWGRFIVAMIKTMGLSRDAHVSVVLSGSVFKSSSDIPRKVIDAIVREAAPNAILLDGRYEPVIGGAAMGLQIVGVQGWREQLSISAESFGMQRRIQ